MKLTKKKTFWADRDEPLYVIARPEFREVIEEDGIEPGWHCTCDLYYDGLDIQQCCESPIHVVSHQIAADYIVSEHLREDYYALFRLDASELRGAVSRVMVASPVAPFLRQLDPREPISSRSLDLIGCFGAASIDRGCFPAKEEAPEGIRKVATAIAARWEGQSAERDCVWKILDGTSDADRAQLNARRERGFCDFLEWLYDAGLPTAERPEFFSVSMSPDGTRVGGAPRGGWFLRLAN